MYGGHLGRHLEKQCCANAFTTATFSFIKYRLCPFFWYIETFVYRHRPVCPRNRLDIPIHLQHYQSITQNQVHHTENQTTVATPPQSTPDSVTINPKHTNSQTNTNARTDNTTPKTVDGPERGRPRIARATARSEKRSESARPYKKSTSRSSSRANVNKHFDSVVLPCAINSTASQQVSTENQSEPDPPPTPTRQATTDGQNLGQ